MEVEESYKIKIVCSSGNQFVWNAEDAVRLREDFRIVGKLCGCLPRAPRQNVHLGIPLQLMLEETTLLLEEGICDLVEEECQCPTNEQLQSYKEQRQESFKEQVVLFREERRQEIQRNLPNIKAGKKAKRQKVLEQRRKAGEEIDDSEFEKDVEVDIDDIPILSIQEKHSLIHLPTETPLPWSGSLKPVEWSFPQSEDERLRYHVFRDLWKQGNYLTSGSKFGGDFLVYPGDPARFHSFYIAICVQHDRHLTPQDMVSFGRLGTTVKKTSVLCSQDENQQIHYTSLQWTGIG